MRIKIIEKHPHARHKVGDVVELPDHEATDLVRHGFAEHEAAPEEVDDLLDPADADSDPDADPKGPGPSKATAKKSRKSKAA